MLQDILLQRVQQLLSRQLLNFVNLFLLHPRQLLFLNHFNRYWDKGMSGTQSICIYRVISFLTHLHTDRLSTFFLTLIPTPPTFSLSLPYTDSTFGRHPERLHLHPIQQSLLGKRRLTSPKQVGSQSPVRPMTLLFPRSLPSKQIFPLPHQHFGQIPWVPHTVATLVVRPGSFLVFSPKILPTLHLLVLLVHRRPQVVAVLLF